MPTADADSVGKRRNESDVDERAVTGRGDTVQQDVDGAADVLPAEAIGTQPAVQQEPVGEREQDRGQGVFGDRRQVAAIDPLPDPPSQDRPVAFHGCPELRSDSFFRDHGGPEIGSNVESAGVISPRQQRPGEEAQALSGGEVSIVQLPHLLVQV
jgi:hypothetical protein